MGQGGRGGGLQREGGLNNFLPRKKGALLERGAYLRGEGGLNREFKVSKFVKIYLSIVMGNNTLGVRGFSCAVSGVDHVSIVKRAKDLGMRA